MAAARISALLAGDKAQREAAYEELSAVVSSNASGRGRANAVAIATACVAPLVRDVQCAPVARVDSAEFQRASLLLGGMMRLDPLVVGAEWMGLDQWPLTHHASESALAVALIKQPGELSRDDVMIAACEWFPYQVVMAKGFSATVIAAGLEESAAIMSLLGGNLLLPIRAPAEDERNVRLMILALEICRDPEGLTEPERTALWGLLWMTTAQRPVVCAAAVEAGIFEVAVALLHQSSPAEWASWCTLAGIQATMIFLTLCQPVLTTLRSAADTVKLVVDSGSASAVIAMLQVRCMRKCLLFIVA